MCNTLDDGLTWYPISDLGNESTLNGIVGNLLTDLLDALLGGILDWLLEGETTAVVDGMLMATPGGANEIFIDGPFGLADQAQLAHGTYDVWDGIAQ